MAETPAALGAAAMLVSPMIPGPAADTDSPEKYLSVDEERQIQLVFELSIQVHRRLQPHRDPCTARWVLTVPVSPLPAATLQENGRKEETAQVRCCLKSQPLHSIGVCRQAICINCGEGGLGLSSSLGLLQP